MAFAPPLLLSPSDAVVHVATAPARPDPSRTSTAERPLWSPGTPPGVWPAARLPLAIALASGPLPPGLRREDVRAELDVALRTWSRPACSGFRARLAPDADVSAADDGTNVVVVHTSSWPAELLPDVPAQTVLHADTSGGLRDADIHLNAARYRFVLGPPAAPGEVDLRSVLVHEVGHVLGLGHATDARATMAVSGAGLRWRSLEQDDVDGLCTLYPGAGDGGCVATACPSGFACVAGACQRHAEQADLCSPCDPAAADACEGAGDGARCVDPATAPRGAPSVVAGSVCGRVCARESDCGPGFSCRPTTAAGDLQCVADDGCRSAANTCARDEDCAAPARCAQGACVGPTRPVVASPSGPASPVDAGASPAPPTSTGSGCAGAPARSAPRSAYACASALAALVALRRRALLRPSSRVR